MATTLVIPEKDSSEGYEQEISVLTDGLGAAGFYPQYSLPYDMNAGIERNVSGDLVLKDANAGSKTLSSLISSGGTPLYDFLLETDPNYTGITYLLTYSGSTVTKETWRITATAKDIKTIDYTYSGGRVSTEIAKIYASDGITVVAQVTTTYSYVSGRVTGYVRTRDV